MKDLTPEESGRWMAAAPPLVQETVTSSATQEVIEQIGKQQTLHVDVVGLLMKLTSYMLLGYAGPEQFLQEMRAIGIPDQQARQIIDDINKKIFVPLRQKMQGGAVEKPQVAPAPPVRQSPPTAWGASAPPAPHPSPRATEGTARPVQMNAPVPSYEYAKPKQSSPLSSPEASQGAAQYFHLENKIPPPLPVPTPPKPIAQEVRPPHEFPKVEPKMQPRLPNGEPQRRMLEDHEEPHLELKRALAQVVPAQVAPMNLPGTVPPVAIPEIKPQIPITKQYVADPYREPIDEK